jgi:hypothetical protein
MHACLDCKVILGECVVPQYKLVVVNFCFRVRFQQSKHVQASRMKWRKRRRLRREFLWRTLDMKEVMQIACGWG